MSKKEQTGIVIHSLEELKRLIEQKEENTMLVVKVEVESDAT